MEIHLRPIYPKFESIMKSKVPQKENRDYSFYENVYEVVKLIPTGRVSSYGLIANYLGTKMSARMVGWAMNNSPKEVPAHRVLNRIGLLTGKHHFKSPTAMQQLLEKEGHAVVNDQLQEFKTKVWDPAKELG